MIFSGWSGPWLEAVARSAIGLVLAVAPGGAGPSVTIESHEITGDHVLHLVVRSEEGPPSAIVEGARTRTEIPMGVADRSDVYEGEAELLDDGPWTVTVTVAGAPTSAVGLVIPERERPARDDGGFEILLQIGTVLFLFGAMYLVARRSRSTGDG